MKSLLEFAPIILFVGVYFYTRDIYVATTVLMAAATVQVVVTYIATRRLEKPLLITFAAIMALGSLTLFYRNPEFLYWKTTVVNGLLAVALLVSHALGHNLIQKMLGTMLDLPANAWRNLAFGWAASFTFAAIANLAVAYNFSEAAWVAYKLWGGITLTAINLVATFLYLRYLGVLDQFQEEEQPAAEPAPPRPGTEQLASKQLPD